MVSRSMKKRRKEEYKHEMKRKKGYNHEKKRKEEYKYEEEVEGRV